MSPGQVQRNPFTGKTIRDNATGKLIRAESTSDLICCCLGTCACDADAKPDLGDTLSVHIAGVVIPFGVCFKLVVDLPGIGAASYAVRFITFPINGTFCLTRIAGTCTYQAFFDILYEGWGGLTFPPCDCGSYNPFCTHVVATQASINVKVSPGFLTAYVEIEQGPDGIPGAYDLDKLAFPFLTVTQDDQSQKTAFIPCGDAVTLNNLATYYATDILDTGEGLFVGSDESTFYPFVGFSGPLPPGVVDGGWPPPTTPFEGTITIMDTPC